MKQRAQRYQAQFQESTAKVTTWRTARRKWELQLVKQWIEGSITIFRPGFGPNDILEARRYVDKQNELDAQGEISPWNIGLAENAWIPTFVHSGKPYKDIVSDDMTELDKAIKEPESEILKLKQQRAKEQQKARAGKRKKAEKDMTIEPLAMS